MVIAANTLAQFFGRFITSGVTFITTILIARQFGTDGYGDFTKITNFVALFYLIADFGFNAIFLQEKKPQFSRFITIRTTASLILVLFCLTIPFVLPFSNNQGFTPPVRQGIIIYSLTIIGQALFTTANAIFQKNLRYDRSVIASSAGSLITLVLVLFAIYRAFPLSSILWMFVLGSVATAILALVLVRIYTKVSFDFDWHYTKNLVRKTLPLGLTLLFNLIYVRIDWFILTLFRQTSEVGIYGLAYKFFEFPLSLPIFFVNSLYPLLLAHAKKADRLKATVAKAVLISLAVSISLSVILFILAPLFTFIKEDFEPSTIPFRILVIFLPFFFLSSLFQWLLIAMRKQKVLLLIYFFSMVINILLNLLFIPNFGFIAASIITGFSETLVFVMLFLFSLQAMKNMQK